MLRRLSLPFLLLASCGSETPPAPGSALAAGLVGTYGQGGHLGDLELRADGTYQSFVMNGVTADGCATFEGAGSSTGSWRLEDGVLSFAPTQEPPDLVVKFREVVGRASEHGVELTYGGHSYELPRTSRP